MKVSRPAPKQPLPPDATRVFKGVIFDVYQWEQEMFDGSTATFERLRRPDTVVVIPVTTDGHLVILEEEQPGRPAALAFPGGRVEPGEDPVAAAARELLEETGYAPGEELVLWEARQPVAKIDWAIYTFVARTCRKAAEPTPDAGERIRTQLTTFEDAAVMALRGQLGEEMALKFSRAKADATEMGKIKKLFGI